MFHECFVVRGRLGVCFFLPFEAHTSYSADTSDGKRARRARKLFDTGREDSADSDSRVPSDSREHLCSRMAALSQISADYSSSRGFLSRETRHNSRRARALFHHYATLAQSSLNPVSNCAALLSSYRYDEIGVGLTSPDTDVGANLDPRKPTPSRDSILISRRSGGKTRSSTSASSVSQSTETSATSSSFEDDIGNVGLYDIRFFWLLFGQNIQHFNTCPVPFQQPPRALHRGCDTICCFHVRRRSACWRRHTPRPEQVCKPPLRLFPFTVRVHRVLLLQCPCSGEPCLIEPAFPS